MGKIFYIMGKSSAGKDSIYNKLIKNRELNLKKIVSYTTRPVRTGEKDGVEYFFVDEDKFKNLKSTGKIIESRSYSTVYGPWYYFLADDGQIDLTSTNYLLIGTLEGYVSLIKYFGEDKIVPIYIQVDDGIRLQRALKREMLQKNPGYEEMCRRFLADAADFSEEKLAAAKINKRFQNRNFHDLQAELINYIKEKMQ